MKFKTILADPPWSFDDRLDETRTLPYEVLSIEDIMTLPIGELVDKEAHLYLWCPASMLGDGLNVMKAWEFDQKTIIIWQKLTKNKKKWFGMGHYFRNTIEVCLFGTKNNLKTRTNNTRNSFEAIKPNIHHSAKPNEMYEIIEQNSYPPYLELFATKKRKNWVSLGYEIDQVDIKKSLEKLKFK